jgi:fructosamine-3-kinase
LIELQPDLDLTTAEAERLLGAWLGSPVTCTGIEPLEGGLVNSVFRLEFDRPPHRAVVKVHGSETNTLETEAEALRYLGTETACPVPRAYLQDSSARVIPYTFLLMEHVPGVCLRSIDLEAAERIEIDVQLAEVLGELHSHRGERWGGLDDAKEPESWADLFTARLTEARIHPAVAKRLAPDVLELIDESIDLAPPALQDAGRPTLVHGDVWDGNLMVRREGGRWLLTGLLDPSLQFADVELELAYLEVFDTPREAFFEAYNQHHPMRPGYEQRRLFYWLHTALVHVALFGDEFFRDFTARTAERITRDRR